MKTSFNVGYNAAEFTDEEMKAFELFITNQTKDRERIPGVMFRYKEALFQITMVVIDADNPCKVVILKQLSPKKDQLIKTPKLEIVRA
jgi:protein-disulfide isomerase-like protein with CxxC motif